LAHHQVRAAATTGRASDLAVCVQTFAPHRHQAIVPKANYTRIIPVSWLRPNSARSRYPWLPPNHTMYTSYSTTTALRTSQSPWCANHVYSATQTCTTYANYQPFQALWHSDRKSSLLWTIIHCMTKHGVLILVLANPQTNHANRRSLERRSQAACVHRVPK
jgi:hypothetical protein